MRAAVHDRYGAPGVVRVADIETPPVGVNQVRVRVRFATVNRTDCGFRAAKPFFIRAMTGILRPKARVLGTEFAGTIDALGSKAGAFTLGERVFGYSERAFGAHAQYLTLSQDGALARIPADVNDEEAAAATEGYRYAQTLVRTARIQPGDAVLVNGATGGIGSAALQILRGLNAEVTAVCDRQYFDLVTRLGASRVIDYTSDDFTTDDATYDVVIDAVGRSSFAKCRRLLRPRGSYLSSELGPWALNLILVAVTTVIGRRRVRFGVPPTYDQALVDDVRRLLGTGAFRPVIDRTFTLDEIVDAYRYVESGQKIGNVLIQIDANL